MVNIALIGIIFKEKKLFLVCVWRILLLLDVLALPLPVNVNLDDRINLSFICNFYLCFS